MSTMGVTHGDPAILCGVQEGYLGSHHKEKVFCFPFFSLENMCDVWALEPIEGGYLTFLKDDWVIH